MLDEACWLPAVGDLVGEIAEPVEGEDLGRVPLKVCPNDDPEPRPGADRSP